MAFAAVIMWFIRKRISRTYMRPMTILFLAFLTMALAGLHFVVISLLLTDGDWYNDNSFVLAPFMIGALFLVWAGYAFNAVGLAPSSPSKSQAAKTSESDHTLIDVVIYVEGLASNPGEVDAIMDDLRQITSRVGASDAPLTAEDKQKLVRMYQQLVTYLTTQEQLKEYTSEGIRQSVKNNFSLDPETEALLG
jgi:hypothetical protein